ncbi:hypothetical protein PybrP1_003140 [[Pythium] brassicae (nom. inval.)]|nr:hypothetical protein PybrP1_003140 [[Pythium] brassicae (nom. inval.)]
MSMETYFRLLKKAQVLETLRSTNSSLHSSEEQLRKLQTEKAKTDTVQQRVFLELEAFQKQYVEVQRFFLEHLEAMTLLCVKEEQLQRGSSADEAQRHAKLTSEDRTLQDLQDATLAVGRTAGGPSGALSSPSSPMVEQICAAYDLQLAHYDTELTRALQSTFTNECLDKIAAAEARERERAKEKSALLERIESLERQNAELASVVASRDDANAQLELDWKRIDAQRLSQQRAIEQFASGLKSELRKRYGSSRP